MPRHQIAYFVSPHGFGHAARAAAIMASLREIDPTLSIEIFTRVPRWFFEDSLAGSFKYHPLLTDIGLAQQSAMREDLPRTVKLLARFLPFDRTLVRRVAEHLTRSKCQLGVCDIAPLGIAVAKQAGIPAVLVENFTWDWIYRGYAHGERRLGRHIEYLAQVFRSADYLIQTEPVCRYRTANLVTPPVSRESRKSRKDTRELLGIPVRAKVVLITMGGIPDQYRFLNQLENVRGVYFVVPGTGRTAGRRGNLILLPHRSEFYHPDLINASDAVVGKLGYSTVAEAYQAGSPLAYVARPLFRESKVMGRFVQEKMQGFEIPASEFQTGEWLDQLSKLLALPRDRRRERNGSLAAAKFIHGLLR